MKDSLLLPVQSNGGTRHSANQSPNRGEVFTETATIGVGNALTADQNSKKLPKDFLETFNRALQLSDEEMAQLMSGEDLVRKETLQRQPQQYSPEVQSLFTASDTMSEDASLANLNFNANTERRVDARTPLALAQFTDSQALDVAFANIIPVQGVAIKEAAQSDISRQILTFENTNAFNSENLLMGEATENSSALTIPDKGSIAEPLSQSKLRIQDIDVEDIPLPARMQITDRQQFETIKGQALLTLSIPNASAESKGNKLSDTVKTAAADFSGPIAEQSEPLGQGITPIAASDSSIISKLWVGVQNSEIIYSDTPLNSNSLGRPINLSLNTIEGSETAILEAPLLTTEVDGDLLSLPLSQAPLSDPTLPGNIYNFRGVLTQDDVERIMLNRPQIDQDIQTEGSIDIAPENLITATDTSDATLNYIKTADGNIVSTPMDEENSTLNFAEDGTVPFNTSNYRAEVDDTKTAAINTDLETNFDSNLEMTVAPEADLDTPVTHLDIAVPDAKVSDAELNDIKTAPDSFVSVDTLSADLSNESFDNAYPNNIAKPESVLPSGTQTQASLESPSIALAPNDNKLAASEASEAKVDPAQTTSSNNRAEIESPKTASTVDANSIEEDKAAAQTVNTDATAQTGDLLTETIPATPPLQMGLGAPLDPINRAVNENNRGTVSLADLQLGTTRSTDPNISELSRKASPKEARDIEADIEREDLPSQTDLRDVEVQEDKAAAQPVDTDATAQTGDPLTETMPATPPLQMGLGAPLGPINRAVNQNNRGTVSLADLQLGTTRSTDPNMSELSRKASPKEARDIEADIEREDLPSQTDLRDVEVQPDDIDLSDLMTEAAETDFDTAKSLPSLGQTALSPLAMSTASSPVLQPVMGLGAEIMSPLASQSQTAAAANPTLSQSPALRQAVVSTVSEALLTAKETPKGVVVQLDPPEMGRVYIDFLFEGDNNVTVVVKSESAESQAILRERQEHFQSLLKESGFNNVTLSFEQQTGSGEGNSETGEDGKEINIALSGQSLEAQAEPYNQRIYQMSNETIRLDMRL